MLIKCLDCGRDVSDAAPACPNCGRPANIPVSAKAVLTSPDATVGDAIKGAGRTALGAAKSAWSIPIAVILLLLPSPVIWLLAAAGLEWHIGTSLAFLLAFPVTFAVEAGFLFLWFINRKTA